MEGFVDRLAFLLGPLDADIVAPIGSPFPWCCVGIVRIEIGHTTGAEVDVAIESSRDQNARERMNLGEGVELLFEKIKLLAFRQRGPRWRVAVAFGILPF